MTNFVTNFERIQLLLIATLFLFMLAACGGSSAETPAASTEPTVEATLAPTVAAEAAATPTEPAETPEAATASQAAGIIVAVNAEFKPFIFMDENNNLVGFDMDLMNAL